MSALRNTKAPLAPPGTMGAFLTACVFINPSTSVRKSSGRFDQRSPPRAIAPLRRWMPSTVSEHTKISRYGTTGPGFASPAESILNER